MRMVDRAKTRVHYSTKLDLQRKDRMVYTLDRLSPQLEPEDCFYLCKSDHGGHITLLYDDAENAASIDSILEFVPLGVAAQPPQAVGLSLFE